MLAFESEVIAKNTFGLSYGFLPDTFLLKPALPTPLLIETIVCICN